MAPLFETERLTARAYDERGEPAADVPFTTRDALAVAVGNVAAHRLEGEYGISWEDARERLGILVTAAVAIPLPRDGRGRSPGARARFVYQMERNDLVGAALSKTNLALIWLLVFGIEDVKGVRAGLTAGQVIERETEKMHRLLAHR
jgi:hypothetical protein